MNHVLQKVSAVLNELPVSDIEVTNPFPGDLAAQYQGDPRVPPGPASNVGAFARWLLSKGHGAKAAAVVNKAQILCADTLMRPIMPVNYITATFEIPPG
jgi:hypothetical protein